MGQGLPVGGLGCARVLRSNSSESPGGGGTALLGAQARATASTTRGLPPSGTPSPAQDWECV